MQHELDSLGEVARLEGLIYQSGPVNDGLKEQERLMLAHLYKDLGYSLAALNEYEWVREGVVIGNLAPDVQAKLEQLRLEWKLKTRDYYTLYDEVEAHCQSQFELSDELKFRRHYLKGIAIGTSNEAEAIAELHEAAKMIEEGPYKPSRLEESILYNSLMILYARIGHFSGVASLSEKMGMTESLLASSYLTLGVVRHKWGGAKELAELHLDHAVLTAESVKEKEERKIGLIIQPNKLTQEYAEKYKRQLLQDVIYARLSRAVFYQDQGDIEKAIEDISFVLEKLDQDEAQAFHEYQLLCHISLAQLRGEESPDAATARLIQQIVSRDPKSIVSRAILTVAQLAYDSASIESLVCLIQACASKELPFFVMRFVVKEMASLFLPADESRIDALKKNISVGVLTIMKEELLKFIDRTPDVKLKTNLILAAFDTGRALNIVFSIPRTDRETSVSRGSFKKLIKMLETLSNRPEGPSLWSIRKAISVFDFHAVLAEKTLREECSLVNNEREFRDMRFSNGFVIYGPGGSPFKGRAPGIQVTATLPSAGQ